MYLRTSLMMRSVLDSWPRASRALKQCYQTCGRLLFRLYLLLATTTAYVMFSVSWLLI